MPVQAGDFAVKSKEVTGTLPDFKNNGKLGEKAKMEMMEEWLDLGLAWA